MERVTEFLNQKKIPVLLLALLSVSTILNVYLYFNLTTKPSYMNDKYTRSVIISRIGIWGLMGSAGVTIEKGLWLGVGYEFNVTIGIGFWEPYIGSATYSFTFKLYNRTLHGEYPDTPIAEKTVSVQKDKDEMWVSAYVILNVTASLDPGIYIYRAVIQHNGHSYAFEFPILVEMGGPVIGPIDPSP